MLDQEKEKISEPKKKGKKRAIGKCKRRVVVVMIITALQLYSYMRITVT